MSDTCSYKVVVRDCVANYAFSSSWTVHACASLISTSIKSVYPPVNGILDSSFSIPNSVFPPRVLKSRHSYVVQLLPLMSKQKVTGLQISLSPIVQWHQCHCQPIIRGWLNPTQLHASPLLPVHFRSAQIQAPLSALLLVIVRINFLSVDSLQSLQVSTA